MLAHREHWELFRHNPQMRDSASGAAMALILFLPSHPISLRFWLTFVISRNTA